MRTTNGKLRLVLSSKKVARIEEFVTGAPSGSLMAWNGQLFANKRRIVVYDYVFDDAQMHALSEARGLAMRTGLVLQVTDLSRRSPLKRALDSGFGRIAGQLRLRTGAKPSLVAVQECDCVSSAVCPP